MSFRQEYNPSKLSSYFEVCLGALIGLGIGGILPLIIGRNFMFPSPFVYIDFIIIAIGFVICIDGIRRLP